MKEAPKLDDGVEQLTSRLSEACSLFGVAQGREDDVTVTRASPERTLLKLGKLATFKTPAEPHWPYYLPASLDEGIRQAQVTATPRSLNPK